MSDNKSSDGLTLAGGLFLVFLTLKLCHVINWSWWWITCPLWGGIVLFIIVGLIYIPLALYFDNRKRKKYGPPKSKWQERMEQMKAAQEKAKRVSNG